MNARHAGPLDSGDEPAVSEPAPARAPALPGSRRARREALEAERARASAQPAVEEPSVGHTSRAAAVERAEPAERVRPAAASAAVDAHHDTEPLSEHVAAAAGRARGRGRDEPVAVGAAVARDDAPAEAGANRGTPQGGRRAATPSVSSDVPHTWQAPSRPRFGAPARRPDAETGAVPTSTGVGFRPVDPRRRTAPAPSIWDVMSGTRHAAPSVPRGDDPFAHDDTFVHDEVDRQWSSAEDVWPSMPSSPEVASATGEEMSGQDEPGAASEAIDIEVTEPEVTDIESTDIEVVESEAVVPVESGFTDTGPLDVEATDRLVGDLAPAAAEIVDAEIVDTEVTDADVTDDRAAALEVDGTELTAPTKVTDTADVGGATATFDTTWASDDLSVDADTAPIAVNRSGVAVVDRAGVVADRESGDVAPESDGDDTLESVPVDRTLVDQALVDQALDDGAPVDRTPVEPVDAATSVVEPVDVEPVASDGPTTDGPTTDADAREPRATAAADATSSEHRAARTDERLAAAFVRLGLGQVVTTGGAGATEHALSTRGVVVTTIERPGAAVAAADVGVRVSGRLGVVLLDDPAAAAASIAEASDAGSGLVVLFRSRGASRDADADLVRASGAIVLADESDRSIDERLEHALQAAALAGRPVVLRVPEAADGDVPARAQHPTTRRSIVAHPGDGRRVRPAPAQLERLQAVLLEAERPVFVAGRGAAEAAGAILALAEECGALLATADANVGLFRESGARSPADIGSVGEDATPLARELYEGADLVVAWGGGVPEPVTALVRIDIEPSALADLDAGQIGVVGDCTLTAVDALQVLQRERLLREAAEAGPRRTGRRAAPVDGRSVEREATALLADEEQAIFEELDPLPPLTDAPPAPMRARSSFTPATARAATGAAAASAQGEVTPPRTGYRSPDVLARIAEQRDWCDVPFEDASGATGAGWRIDARRLVAAIDEALPDDRVVVVAPAPRARDAARRLVVRDAAGRVPAVSRNTDALASAIGAARSAPARLPVLVTDDSGFRGGLAELGTAVRSRIPLVVVVLDASPAGAEDLAAVAGALGAQEVRVREPGDLGAVTRQLAERSPGDPSRPLVIVANVAERAD